MRDIWVISDTHFNHGNIIRYCNRPFNNVHHMNEVMIENWNKVVKPGDIVYHCGDVYFSKHWKAKKTEDANLDVTEDRDATAEFIFQCLNGRKRLIPGNHDDCKDPLLQKYFQKIQMWRYFKEFGLLLTHVPIHPSSLIEKKHGENRNFSAKNVHGHIHQHLVKLDSGIPDKRYINVSVEHINYTPIHIEELAKR